jgi:hypothetical protein
MSLNKQVRWLLAAPLACSTVQSGDSGIDSGATADAADDGLDIGDAVGDGPSDGGKIQHRVDASGDCGAGWDDAGKSQVRTCCGGTRCYGWCYEPLNDDSGPYCDCAGVPGGCMNGFICCRLNESCQTGDGACGL